MRDSNPRHAMFRTAVLTAELILRRRCQALDLAGPLGYGAHLHGPSGSRTLSSPGKSRVCRRKHLETLIPPVGFEPTTYRVRAGYSSH